MSASLTASPPRRCSSFEQLDNALHSYYASLNRHDYYDQNGNGKLSLFCIANGINIDDIDDELSFDASDCLLVDFDASFPLPSDAAHCKKQHTNAIKHGVIKHCYEYGRAPHAMLYAQNVPDTPVNSDGLLVRIDCALAEYYRQCGRTDYYSRHDDGTRDDGGRFAVYCTANGISSDDIAEELQFDDAMHCLLIDFDANFPCQRVDAKTETRAVEIFTILKHCQQHGMAPRVQQQPQQQQQQQPSINANEKRLFAQSTLNELTYNCTATLKCDSVQRIELLLTDAHCLHRHRITICNSDHMHYDILCLLNDHMHVLRNHECLLEAMSHCASCDIQQCVYLRRLYRADDDAYNANEDAHSKVLKDAMATVHCYVLHSFAMGFKLTRAEQQICTVDVDSDREDDDEHSTDQLRRRRRKYNSEKRVQKHRALNSSDDVESDEKICTETAENRNSKTIFDYNALLHILASKSRNKIAMSNKFQTQISNPRLLHFGAANVNDALHSKDSMTCEWFHHFYYDDAYKHKRESDATNFGLRFCDLYVAPKYLNIKDEILHIGQHNVLAVQEWASIAYKANMLLQTQHFKRSYRAHAWNYGIARNSVMRGEHALCLVLYCDYSALAVECMQTFLPQKQDDTLAVVKTRHRNFYWFARNLSIVVELFGQDPTSDGGDSHGGRVYYHGVSARVALHCSVLRMNHLHSVTDSVAVACLRCCAGTGRKGDENNGMLLALTTTTSSSASQPQHHHRVFDVRMMSLWTGECEKLCVGYNDGKLSAFDGLQIVDIVLCSAHKSRMATHRTQVRAFHIFMHAMNGECPKGYCDRLSSSTSSRDKRLKASDQSIILDIIEGNKCKFDAYFNAMLNAFQTEKKIVILDARLMKSRHIYSFMAAHFVASSKSCTLQCAIKLHAISAMFRNVRQIVITNGSGADHKTIAISSQYLSYLLSAMLGAIKKNSFLRLTQIKIRNVFCAHTNVSDLVDEFEHKYNTQIGFHIFVEHIIFHNKDYYTLFIVKL